MASSSPQNDCTLSLTGALSEKQIILEVQPGYRIYRDGRFERDVLPTIPPSLDDPITGVSSKDISISPEISARLHLPKLNSPNQKLPIMVYFHGGLVFTSASEVPYHEYMNALVEEANVIIVSVEYRRPPEHPLPTAYEDSWSALQWIASHPDSEAKIEKEPWLINHGDFKKFFLNGDSGGGNIVHNMLVKAGTVKLQGNVQISGAVIAFPYFGESNPVRYMSNETEDRFCTLWNFAYPSAPGGINCPMFNPLADGAPSLAQLGCSKVLVVIAELDDLRARGLEYVDAVKKSEWNGEIALVDIDGEGHCFQLGGSPYSEKARVLIKSMTNFLLRRKG